MEKLEYKILATLGPLISFLLYWLVSALIIVIRWSKLHPVHWNISRYFFKFRTKKINVFPSAPDLDPYGFGLPGSGSFHHPAEKLIKTLVSDVKWHLNDFLSLETDVNVPQKVKREKNLKKKFLLGSWKSLMKRAGSGSGSVNQVYGPKNPNRIRTKSRIRNTGLRIS